MNKDAIFYIDFGSNSIRVIVGEVQENNAIKIIAHREMPSNDTTHGIIEQTSAASQKISEMVTEIAKSLKIRTPVKATICRNARSIKSDTITYEETITNFVSETLLKNMKSNCIKALTTENFTVSQIEPIAYYIDGIRELNANGQKGKSLQIDYNIIGYHPKVDEKIHDTFNRSTVLVDHIHLGIEAESVALLDEDERKTGCVIISFGASTTSLGIYYGDKLLYTKVVPLGGNNISYDLKEVLGISYRHAEIVKKKKGYAMASLVDGNEYITIPAENDPKVTKKISVKYIADIIEARLDESLAHFFTIIEQFNFPLESGIVITGGASKLAGLQQYLSIKTSLPVRMGNHSDWLSDNTDESYADSTYSMAIGAISLSGEENKAMPSIDTGGVKPGNNVLNKLKIQIQQKVNDLFSYDEIEKKKFADNKKGEN